MKKIFLIVAAAVAFSGCSSEEAKIQETPKEPTAKERRQEAAKNYENKFLIEEEKK